MSAAVTNTRSGSPPCESMDRSTVQLRQRIGPAPRHVLRLQVGGWLRRDVFHFCSGCGACLMYGTQINTRRMRLPARVRAASMWWTGGSRAGLEPCATDRTSRGQAAVRRQRRAPAARRPRAPTGRAPTGARPARATASRCSHATVARPRRCARAARRSTPAPSRGDVVPEPQGARAAPSAPARVPRPRSDVRSAAATAASGPSRPSRCA